MMRIWTSVFHSAGLYKYFEVSQQPCWSEYIEATNGNENKAGERENINGKYSDMKGDCRRKMGGK